MTRHARTVFLSVLPFALAACSQPSAKPPSPDGASHTIKTANLPTTAWRGMTWRVIDQSNGVVRVGYDQQTNPYSGDTAASESLPILCLLQDGRAAPYLTNGDGWAGGEVRLTLPVSGAALTSRQMADSLCKTEFGTTWRMAAFHDAPGGWRWNASGTLSTSSRFWVAIDDQNANPWNSDGTRPDAVIPQTTKVLGSADRSGLQAVSDDQSILTFAASSPVVASLSVGDTLASDAALLAPYGFLRKVTGITRSGSQVTVTTVEGSLEEAIQDGDVMDELPLSSASINYDLSGDMIQAQRGKLQSQASIRIGKIDVNPYCYYDVDADKFDCGSGAKLAAQNVTNKVAFDAHLDAEARAFVNLSIRRFSIRYFDAGVQLTENASLSIDAYAKSNFFEKEVDIERWRIVFNSFTVYIGPVPLRITPMLTPTVGAKGTIEANLSYKVEQKFNAKYGVKWDGGWSTISWKDPTNGVTETPLKVSGTLDIRGTVGMKAALAFYKIPVIAKDGLGQIFVHPRAYVGGKATVDLTSRSTKLCGYTGLSVDVGAAVPVLRKQPWTKEILDTSTNFACWTDAVTPAPVITPPPSTICNDTLISGATMNVNEKRTSCSGNNVFILQGDGNLVLYKKGAAAWASHTWGSNAASRLTMGGDGHLALYNSAGGRVWSAGTWGHPGAYLRVQDDGNVVVYEKVNGQERALWSSNTWGW